MRAIALVIGTLALAVPQPAQRPASTPTRAMAVTIDDLPYVHHAPDGYLPAAQRGTRAILAALKAHRAPVVGFVNEAQLLAPASDERTARIALLQQWVDAGHLLGNHTYSHPDANALTAAAYLDEVDKGEIVTRRLMQAHAPYTRYFRYPMTHTGDTADKKDAIARGLAARGYTVAPHTIETGDFLFDAAYARAAAADRPRLVEAYLAHSRAATAFAETKAAELFGRDDIPQTLVIHSNALNADALDALLSTFEARGYRFISLDEARRDRAYATPDAYVGTFGPTWLFRWSRTLAPASSFRADPDVPGWVEAAAAAGAQPR